MNVQYVAGREWNFQTEHTYPECTWHRIADGYVGFPNGKTHPLPRWYVDREGKVPSYSGPVPEGIPPYEKTHNLWVNPKGIFDEYPDEKEIMLQPAIFNDQGEMFNPFNVPQEEYNKWKDLPTK